MTCQTELLDDGFHVFEVVTEGYYLVGYETMWLEHLPDSGHHITEGSLHYN
jgi:hypothetical protein